MAKQSIATEELCAIQADISNHMAVQSDRGEVATYIPQLAKVDPTQFALTIVTAEATVISDGDVDTPFSIQSVPKVFTLAPMQASICYWSPGLNKIGNSKLASGTLEMLADPTGWSVFAIS
jgi:glutaminase